MNLFEINTRVWLHELSARSPAGLTLAEVPDEELDAITAAGFDWVWLMGVWQTGPRGQAIAQRITGLRREYQEALPDYTDSDICGSPYAVQRYVVHAELGGEPALRRLRDRLRDRGVRLMLDFVPNHTALDHPWAYEHPEYFVPGTEADLRDEPGNYCVVETAAGPKILAHGRDPYFPGWTDTLQLNYRHPALREAVKDELVRIAGHCDGLRCDMAILLLPDVIYGTWGDAGTPPAGTPPVNGSFWPEAIGHVRRQLPQFLFLAEAYWDLEWTLQQQGFDYTYDKRLYDRLRDRQAGPVRDHLLAALNFQKRLARFLENHDEPRAAAVFPEPIHQAAAVVTYLTPGLKFCHEGQFEGRRVKVPVQLYRRPAEAVDSSVREFYAKLLPCLSRPEVRKGTWRLLEARPAWEGNHTWRQFLAFAWEDRPGQRLLVTVNYGPDRGQCYVPLPLLKNPPAETIRLRDLLNPVAYERTRQELISPGLYLDVPGWAYHVFQILPA